MNNKISVYFPWLLLVFHAIGLSLFLTDPGLVSLTPVNMLLCGFLIFLTEKNRNVAAIAYVIIFLCGFLIEVIGIRTGLLFGNYAYGDVLGTKLLNVPVIIGVNWFVIIVSSVALFVNLKIPVLLKILLAALAATAMDALIEPVAIRYHFWNWEHDTVPFYNYVCWFIFSILFAFVYLRFSEKQNRTAFFLYFIWIVFFVTLNLS